MDGWMDGWMDGTASSWICAEDAVMDVIVLPIPLLQPNHIQTPHIHGDQCEKEAFLAWFLDFIVGLYDGVESTGRLCAPAETPFGVTASVWPPQHLDLFFEV